MKIIAVVLSIFLAINLHASDKFAFNFKNEEITQILDYYSKKTGQKFIIDSTVRGKVTLLSQDQISAQEAFNQLSEALAINGFAIVNHADYMTVKNARSAQRDLIETSTQLPAAKPQRLATWVVLIKNHSASDVGRDVRLITSSYGEMSINSKTNQIIISDWTSNLQRVAQLINTIDVPAEKSVAQFIKNQPKQSEVKIDNNQDKPAQKEK